MKSKGAIDRIVKKYGETNSLEGTYKDFLAIKKDLEKLHKIEKIYKKSQKYNDYSADDAICDIGEVLNDEI